MLKAANAVLVWEVKDCDLKLRLGGPWMYVKLPQKVNVMNT